MRDQSDMGQHSGMCLGGLNIVGRNQQVECSVHPHGELIYFLVSRLSFIPEFHGLAVLKRGSVIENKFQELPVTHPNR